ncbi:MAG: AbrB/MazE/SpoVT family DNA-binding domain-containing protein [Niveispirillum sp.]|nr:AbrB/MazE/SpoVT family DNA-binding domain-containing protein [Niveispirillum sp.]
MATTITIKGQVTIPKPIRDRLDLKPGSEVDFELMPDGRVVLIKRGDQRIISRFEGLRGQAGPGLSTDEIMALTRGDSAA